MAGWSTSYRLPPRPMHSATATSISFRLIVSTGNEQRTTTGFVLASAGKSHSCETPTSWSPRPRAYAISVAAGRKETMRRLFMGICSKYPWHSKIVRLSCAAAMTRIFSVSVKRLQFVISDNDR